MGPIKHILVATDFSDDANRALELAAEMARAFSSKITLLHVVQMPSYAFYGGGVYVPAPELTAEIMADAMRTLDGAKARLKGIEVATACIDGDPATRIVGWAEAHSPDLVVLGTHGRRGLRRLVLGSVAERVVRSAPCPVLTVRASEKGK